MNVYPNDLIVFINEIGATQSFVRADNHWFAPNAPQNGFPTDEDMEAVRNSGRMYILIRDGYVVAMNLVK